MRYWVYINDKVDGPYDETNLVTLEGFTPDTLICSEEVASSGGQEWVKASSIFEFDEIPVNEPVAQQPLPQQSAAQAQSTAQMQSVFAKLATLTSDMSTLQSKLDAMQHNLDYALEQNKKLSDQVNQLSHATVEAAPIMPTGEDAHTNTITLTRHDLSAKPDANTPANDPVTPIEEPVLTEQAAPEEEEIVIRSALDSIYGGKPVQIDDTFQDLIPAKTAEKEEQAVQAIESNLEFIPLNEEKAAEQEPASAANSVETEAVSATKEEPLPVQDSGSSITEEAEPLSAEALSEIEKEMTFMSLEENKEAQTTQEEKPSTEEPAADVVQEAIITTPGVEETAKDALINELTASPKEDVLDQIIAEHPQEQPVAEEEKSSAGEIALGAAAAGLAAAAVVSLVDKEEAEPAPMAIATDKENPDKLEEVLPAQQMPQDVPVSQPEPEPVVADLPSLEQTPEVPQPVEQAPKQEAAQIPVADMPEELPQAKETEPTTPQIPVADMPEEMPQPVPQKVVAEKADFPSLEQQAAIEQVAAGKNLEEESLEELVPGSQDVSEEPETEPEGFYDVQAEPQTQQEELVSNEETSQNESEPSVQGQKEEPAQEEPFASQESPVEQENPVEQPVIASGAITDKDLQDAFGNDDTEPVASPAPAAQVSVEPMPEGNPNDLTEIELKEGSTYLISDFVPPAQLTDNVAEVMNSKQAEPESQDKKQETIFQDMLAAVTKSQSTKALDTEGLPDDLAATRVNLENTIQAKRGASLDIKTVPMVPEPGNTQRLDVDELTDVNAQHGLKTSGGLSKSTKKIIFLLIGLLVLIILYVVLGMMKLLPASINVLASKKQQAVAAQTAQEFLPQTQAPAVAEEVPQGPTPAEQAQEKVQNFALPNGTNLKSFIEAKHAAVSPELITWETTESVEEDNYSVTVKVPPENPQSFKTVYRFNYNMTSGLLSPTVSDAKNLLDQAYAPQQAAQPKATAAQPAPKKTTRSSTRKGTARKRTN
ncbi:MAG: hypothetical protein J6Q05_03140 [Elusimicrobiaceae bacterium]|nr:hypothetical protein [Elusimicrobiaceae bacterium]